MAERVEYQAAGAGGLLALSAPEPDMVKVSSGTARLSGRVELHTVWMGRGLYQQAVG
jgi:hypothetical protein